MAGAGGCHLSTTIKLAMAEVGDLQIGSPISSTESPPMEEPPALGADWSKLPTDILNLIQGELEFPDLFRSAAVCPSWRAAAKSLLRHGLYFRPQAPCLLYCTAGAGPCAAELYSLSDKSTYTIPLPDPPIAERNIVGSSHGWLVTADARSELHLLNPATGEQLELPPVATIEQVSPVLDDAGDLQRYDLSFYDATLPRKEDQPPQPYAANMYVARTSSGDFVQIWRITTIPSEDSLETHTSDLEIFKVDLDKQQTIDIDTLNNDCLFIGHNCSCCISTKDYPGLWPNHVYFTDDDEYVLMDQQDYRRDVGVYSLENKNTTEIVTPEPWLSRPMPIWITPSFTKINK